MVFFYLQVLLTSGVKRLPPLTAGDVTALEEIFKDHPVCRLIPTGKRTLITISRGEAEEFYKALVKHYAEHGVSAELYHMGSGLPPGELESVFREQIAFCEKEFGFTSPKELIEQIEARLATRSERTRERDLRMMREHLDTIASIPLPGTIEVCHALRAKLAEYQERKSTFTNPKSVEVLDTHYKILVVEYFLAAKSEVSPRELFEEVVTKEGESVDAKMFFNALVVIAHHYLKTPLKLKE
jgi:hypothetical protein